MYGLDRAGGGLFSWSNPLIRLEIRDSLIHSLEECEVDYGFVTSTTRKPTSESGQVEARKSREAKRLDELG